MEAVCRQEGLECNYLNRTIGLDQDKIKRVLPTGGERVDLYPRELLLTSAHDVKFVLSGWGGDEGISHRASLNELFLRGYWGRFLREIRKSSKGSPLRFAK